MNGPVRLAYKPYFFSQRTVFFSHNKSANSTFSHDLSAKRPLVLLGSALLFHPLDVDAHAPPMAGSYSTIDIATTSTSLMSLPKCSAAATRLLHRSWSRPPWLSLDLSSRAGGPWQMRPRPRPHGRRYVRYTHCWPRPHSS